MISDKKEKKILCYRRYGNFSALDKFLKKQYPYLLIPKLTEKNKLTKIVDVGSEFLDNRLRQLNHYINFIYHHHQLKDSVELKKFLKDPEFDSAYFLSDKPKYNFAESLKYNSSFSNKLMGVFNNYFK